MCITSEQFVSPIPVGASKSSIEQFASDVAEQLNFHIADNIMLLASQLGGKIVTGSSGPEDEESGSLIASSFSDFTIYISPLTSMERDRFTIAHELGHLLIHLPKVQREHPSAVMRATRYIDENSSTLRRAEWEANWFAAALLMPSDIFRAQANYGIGHLKDLFQVSGSAIRARAKSLGVDI